MIPGAAQRRCAARAMKKRRDLRHGASAGIAGSSGGSVQQHFPAPDPYRAF
ncbi:hypothetical protein BURMUCF1_A2063 [Burkholderia multivorans ATCC BAA-247]|uniref:Uncharacterized protein n=1 Tax=Burkholderia multivorans CGD2 TaxID=513052 RepID=B9BYL9_9BURK|nr:hypothetical protein BURMUCGD2_3575 [Burkholderia multivorans CGD2]EEE11607.1 hypothetical protein BURMUCGD2M_3565 [Burkholderia multivorans CGD2M]EJO51185.1 hypothetical protein BURMUCF1_A2063 [Burkholderia multivorans ATCC BAA-247]